MENGRVILSGSFTISTRGKFISILERNRRRRFLSRDQILCLGRVQEIIREELRYSPSRISAV